MFIISYLDYSSANWLLLIFSHNLLSIWVPELSGTQDAFVFSGSDCIQNESKHPQMAFLVSTYYHWSLFHSTDFSQGLWGSSCSHMQIIATPRQDPGSCGSEPFSFHPLGLAHPSPDYSGRHCLWMRSWDPTSSQVFIANANFFLAYYFINISQATITRPYLYIYSLEGDPLKGRNYILGPK